VEVPKQMKNELKEKATHIIPAARVYLSSDSKVDTKDGWGILFTASGNWCGYGEQK
jgi:hypothetical protein